MPATLITTVIKRAMCDDLGCLRDAVFHAHFAVVPSTLLKPAYNWKVVIDKLVCRAELHSDMQMALSMRFCIVCGTILLMLREPHPINQVRLRCFCSKAQGLQ